MFTYSHLGDDIGADESVRCQTALKKLITSVSFNKSIDSPLYEFIRDISPPILPEDEYHSVIKDLANREKHIFALVERALNYMKESQFDNAFNDWVKASTLLPSEPYFIQQQALCKYKSKIPSENTALIDALKIIAALEPDGETNDPETLGITGAIYKNLWLLESDSEYLNRSIKYYGKCFMIRRDYYTGENYALCLNLKEKEEQNSDEKIYLKIVAQKTREEMISLLEKEVEKDDFHQRNDKKWVYATLSQCYYALNILEKSEDYKELFLNSNIVDWERDTFECTREQLKALIVY